MSKKFKKITYSGHEFSDRNNRMTVSKGGKSVSFHIPKGVCYSTNNGIIKFEGDNISMIGTVESLCVNAINGLNKPHSKHIKLVGIGYKMSLEKNVLALSLGFSHIIYMPIPETIDAKLNNPTNVILTCADNALLGNFAASLCKLRYNPYTGCGVIDVSKEHLLIRKEVKRK